MKLYLASYFEQDNHGPGRKIGISPGKPKDLDYECNDVFEPFSPGNLYWDYIKSKKIDYEGAAEVFNEGYKAKLDSFLKDLSESSKIEGKEYVELLPFEDGDTLLSWEKSGNLTYRSTLADYLREIGYDVEEN